MTYLTRQHCFYVGTVFVFTFCELFLLLVHLPLVSFITAAAWVFAAVADASGSIRDFVEDLEAYAKSKSPAQGVAAHAERGVGWWTRTVVVLGTLYEVLYKIRRKARE